MAKVLTINDIDYYSYADLEDANVYNNAVYGSTWSSIDDVAKAQLLVMSTRKIDSYKYIGSKVDIEQPLQFPRISNSGKVSDEQLLIDLCCQVADYYYANGYSAGGGGGSAGYLLNNLKEYKMGDLQVNFKDDAKIDLSGLDDIIEQALKDWLTSQSMELWL